jgi:hypothetical protein
MTNGTLHTDLIPEIMPCAKIFTIAPQSGMCILRPRHLEICLGRLLDYRPRGRQPRAADLHSVSLSVYFQRMEQSYAEPD